MTKYDQAENGFIATFAAHPFFTRIVTLSDEQFRNYLLQLSRTSLQFEKWLLQGSLAVEDEQARRLMWATLSEEIPVKGAPHKYLLSKDLQLIGVSLERFLNVKPSRRTRETIRKMYALFKFPQANYDLVAMLSWRVLTEVLVSTQYGFVLAELQRRFSITPEQTVFYGDHWKHDMKGAQGSHTGYSDRWLDRHIVDEETLGVAITAAKQAMKVRYLFHSQEF